MCEYDLENFMDYSEKSPFYYRAAWNADAA